MTRRFFGLSVAAIHAMPMIQSTPAETAISKPIFKYAKKTKRTLSIISKSPLLPFGGYVEMVTSSIPRVKHFRKKKPTDLSTGEQARGSAEQGECPILLKAYSCDQTNGTFRATIYPQKRAKAATLLRRW